MQSDSGTTEPADVRLPISEVLKGLEIHALEPGDTAIETFVLI